MRAVRTVLDSGRPIAQVAKDLDVGSESLRTWVRRARPGAPTSEQLEELRRLRSENRELRKANETLKAASVFFAVELDRTPRR
jgi:transposase